MTTKTSRISTATPWEYSHVVSNFIHVKMRRNEKTLKTTNEEQSDLRYEYFSYGTEYVTYEGRKD